MESLAGGDINLITGWIAPKRFGKTLGMTSRLLKAHEAGRKVFTNYDTTFTDEKVNSEVLEAMAKDEIELKDVALGLDEIHVIIDPRTGMSKRNRRLTYLISQSGKRNVNLHYTTQQQRKVEIRLWDDTDYLVYPRPMGNDLFFNQVLCGPASQTPGAKKGAFILHGPKYYPYYDTTEHIKDFLPDNPRMIQPRPKPIGSEM